MGDKHAFLIIAHGHFSILKKLLIMLDDPRNDIYLHIDKHVKQFDFEGLERLVKRAGLFFTPRIKVYWGHSSQVDCELLLLGEFTDDDVLREAEMKFDNNDVVMIPDNAMFSSSFDSKDARPLEFDFVEGLRLHVRFSIETLTQPFKSRFIYYTT